MYKTFQWVILFIAGLIFVAPIIYVFVKSFTYGWIWPDIVPTNWGVRGWKVVLQDPILFHSIFYTLWIAVIVVVLNMIIAIPAARTLSYYAFKGKTVIETILLMPLLMPILAVAMGIHFTMIRFGLADQVIGVIVIHLLPTLPYSLLILRASFDKIGRKWEEQALTLGCSPMRSFWSVTLPMLLPGLRSASIVSFVISISQYVLTAIIGGGTVTTLSMLYFPYFGTTDEAILSSFTVLFALLPLLFIVVVEGLVKLYRMFIRQC